ncbi:MAG: WG repeat-containing protein [Niastella sp.]|nr:WG repeat-containing protein [Niastella sp.]
MISKSTINCLLAISICFLACSQAPPPIKKFAVKNLELKRLELENKYGHVGDFDTATGIATVYDKGYMGYIDTSGHLILPIQYVTTDFSDGMGVYNDIENKLWKAIDENGKIIKEYRHISSLQPFKNGLAIFSSSSPEASGYGVMDFKGNVVIKNNYPYLKQLSEKLYYANNNNTGAGIINAVGDTIIPLIYNILYTDTFDCHFIGYKNDVGFANFDSSGKVKKYWGKNVYIEKSLVEGGAYFQRDSLIIIRNQLSSLGDVKTALVNLEFDTIVPMGKYNLKVVNEGRVLFYDSVIVKQLNKRVTTNRITKCGFLDTKGKVVIPAKFEFAQYFCEGLSAVVQDGKWGYIDKEGRTVIPFQFTYALPFHNGYAKVKMGADFFIIDRTGKVVLNSKSF